MTAARPSYPPPAYSVTVPFANAPDFAHLDTTLKLLASVNGGPAAAFTVDTGSVGVVLPASEIPGFDPKSNGTVPGELRYSSSGLKLTGYWTPAVIRFLNPKSKGEMVNAIVDVLAVTQGTCTGGGANAGHCTGNIPHMLGVGFGRGYDKANGMRTQANNPFVNLKPMNAHDGDAVMHHGFLITRAGIIFGLTATETHGFDYVKLTPAVPELPLMFTFADDKASDDATHAKEHAAKPFARDYETAPGYLTLGTHDFPMGVVLIDTGLTNMIVEEPDEAGEHRSGDLPNGESATVHLLGNQFRYGFVTGAQTQSVAPRRATWARYTHGPFINTGLRALACFDYLYDADDGYLGLRPTCKVE